MLWHELATFAATVSTLVAMVVWIVKASFTRQSAITDRYFAHLEETQRYTRETNDRIAASFDHLSGPVARLNAKTDEQAALLRELTEGMGATRLTLDALSARVMGLEEHEHEHDPRYEEKGY